MHDDAWCLHAGRQALEGVHVSDRARAGLIMGNLSYPSAAMAAHAIHPLVFPDEALHFEYSTNTGVTGF